MIQNPCEMDYPYGVYSSVTIKSKRLPNGVWEVYCPEWKCVLHDNNLTRCVAGLLTEIESHNEMEETGEPSRFSPKWDENKWRQQEGLPRLKPGALPPQPKSVFNRTVL